MILGENDQVIYHEALGRYVWHEIHNGAGEAVVNEVLCLVKSIEYLCARLERKLVFLDKETSPSAEDHEIVGQENRKQEALQEQCEIVEYRLVKLKNYLQEGFSEKWLKQIIYDMVNSEHSAIVCKKMKGRRLIKFVHQITGVLLQCKVVDNCIYGDLADALGFNKPERRQSKIDYIRHMIDDAKEIQTWLENYIYESKKD